MADDITKPGNDSGPMGYGSIDTGEGVPEAQGINAAGIQSTATVNGEPAQGSVGDTGSDRGDVPEEKAADQGAAAPAADKAPQPEPKLSATMANVLEDATPNSLLARRAWGGTELVIQKTENGFNAMNKRREHVRPFVLTPEDAEAADWYIVN